MVYCQGAVAGPTFHLQRSPNLEAGSWFGFWFIAPPIPVYYKRLLLFDVQMPPKPSILDSFKPLTKPLFAFRRLESKFYCIRY